MKRQGLAWLVCLWATGAGAGPLDILTDTKLGDARRAALETAVTRANAWLEQETGRALTGQFVVLGADRRSLSHVLDAGYARLDKPRPAVPDIANRI